MFDDQEENQDQPKLSPARLRFSYWLAGLDPDSGMPPRTPQADPTETWLALQAKQPFSPKPSIGQPLMQPNVASGQSGQHQPYSATQTGMTPATRPGNLAQSRSSLQREPRIKPKLSIGERLMQMDLDAASGKRTGIRPKLTLGQRLMGLDGSEGFRVDNPQAQQGFSNRFSPASASPSRFESTNNRWSTHGQTAFARSQQAASTPRPNGSASIVDVTAQTKVPSRISRPAAVPDVKPNPNLELSDPTQQAAALGGLLRDVGGPENPPLGVSPGGSLMRDVTYLTKSPSRIFPESERSLPQNEPIHPTAPGKQLPATANKGHSKAINSFAHPNWQKPELVKANIRKALAKYIDIIDAAADKYHIPRVLFESLIYQESQGIPEAASGKKAVGLAQLTPDTAATLGVKDVHDPTQNLEGGARYFRDLLTQYEGNAYLALQAYNAGPGRVSKYHGIVPFKETRDYARRILGFQKVLEQDDKAPQAIDPDRLVQAMAGSAKAVLQKKAEAEARRKAQAVRRSQEAKAARERGKRAADVKQAHQRK